MLGFGHEAYPIAYRVFRILAQTPSCHISIYQVLRRIIPTGAFALERISQCERETRLLELWVKQSEDAPKGEP